MDWKEAWRGVIAPCLSTDNLIALESALALDSPQLLQRATCIPPPCEGVGEWPVEACCPLAWMGAAEHGGVGVYCKGGYSAVGKIVRLPDQGTATVAEVAVWFAEKCREIQDKSIEALEVWTTFWDFSPRAEAVAGMLQEVRHSIALRRAEGGSS